MSLKPFLILKARSKNIFGHLAIFYLIIYANFRWAYVLETFSNTEGSLSVNKKQTRAFSNEKSTWAYVLETFSNTEGSLLVNKKKTRAISNEKKHTIA